KAARAEHERRTAERQAQADDVQRQVLAIEKTYREKVAAGGKVAHRDIDDLRYRFYRDTFEVLPDFDAIKHEDEGQIESGQFDLRLRTRDRAIGFVFEGHLLVPEDGEYEFLVHSDDGAKLTIHG